MSACMFHVDVRARVCVCACVYVYACSCLKRSYSLYVFLCLLFMLMYVCRVIVHLECIFHVLNFLRHSHCCKKNTIINSPFLSFFCTDMVAFNQFVNDNLKTVKKFFDAIMVCDQIQTHQLTLSIHIPRSRFISILSHFSNIIMMK